MGGWVGGWVVMVGVVVEGWCGGDAICVSKGLVDIGCSITFRI